MSSSRSNAARSASARALKRVELVHQRFVRGPHPVARDVGAVCPLAAAPGPPEVPVLREVDRARFPAVVVGRAEPHHGLDLVSELADGPGVQEQRIAAGRGRRGQRGQLADTCHRAAERLVAIERVAPPRAAEVAPFGQLARGAPQPIDRGAVGRRVAAVRRPDAAPERTPHTLGRILEPLVQPAAERVGEQPLGARLGQHVEQRIHPRFHRTLAQEVGAEAVDRADVRFLEALDRIRQVRAWTCGIGCPLARRFQLLPDAQLQLAGRLLGEGHGDDLIDARPAARRAR